MNNNLCDTCRHGVEGTCPCPDNIFKEVFNLDVVECGRYRCIAFIEDVDDGGRTYRCSFCGQLISSWTEKCPECGAEYGR